MVARLRMALAIGAVATGSFLPHLGGRIDTLLLILGLVWLPCVTVVVLAADRADNVAALVGGLLADLLALFLVQVMIPGSGQAVLLGYLVVIAVGVYTTRMPVSALLVAATTALLLTSQVLVPAVARLGPESLIPFSAAMVALLLLLDRTASLRARAVARADQLQTRSDTILAHVAEAVVVTDGTGRLLQCNPAAEHVVGLERRHIVDHRCEDVLGLHHGERPLDCSRGCPLLRLAAAGDGPLQVDLWRREHDGRRQPMVASAALVGDADGRVEVVHTLRDVTRFKQAEEAKTLFLATASHELKTPLTVIRGFADTLASFEDLDPPTKHAALAAIRTRTMELTRILDRLLLSSRIEAGRVTVALGTVELGPLLEERIAALSTATRRTIVYRPAGEPPSVLANQDALVTVVDHLLDNAVKYSPNGDPVAVDVADDAGAVRFEVIDHGIGMDSEQVSHCFEKFWQAESTDVRRFGGTGIGLYIVQSLVEAMGGRIDVRSARSQGTTVTVHLGKPPPAPQPGMGEGSLIREFMRQIGVPERGRR